MVRLKQRYILFDILTPPSADNLNFARNPHDALIALCQSSASTINAKLITQLVRKLIQDTYGDYGLGMVGLLITVKYFNNKTSSGIIRCSRQSFPLVMASLTLLNKIGDQDVIIRCVHVSGTIKKCEDYAIRKNREVIAALAGKKGERYENLASDFVNDPLINLEEDLNLS